MNIKMLFGLIRNVVLLKLYMCLQHLTFYETIIHPEGEVVELTVMTVQNTCVDLPQNSNKKT
jgi:hypothetical protein